MISKKHIILTIISITSFAIILLLINFPRNTTKHKYNNKNKMDLSRTYEENNYDNQNIENVEVNYLLDLFKKRYTNNLYLMRSKIRLLGGLIKHYKKLYPKYWREQLIDTITNEFPDHADELMKYLDKTEKYYEFIKEDSSLLELTYNERKDKIWEKRKEIFGEEYKSIWASEIRKEQMSAFVETLNQKKEMNFEQKLDTYKNTIDEIYNSKEDTYKDSEDIKIQQMKLANRFLNMDSIQNELGQMTPGIRKETLRNIRLEIGLDTDTVNRLEEIDKMRERLWKTGTAYSAIRGYIISKFSGSTQQDKLDEARKKHFGELADVIKKEEETFRYYRFNNPHKWGVD